MKTEKEKMLASDPYKASDPQLQQERIDCRIILKALNNSLPETSEWATSISQLIDAENEIYIEPPFFCDYGYNIIVGKNFYANFNCIILDVNTVTIGDDVMFAPNVQILTATHPVDKASRVDDGVELGLPVVIGDNVWLGAGVIVCPGVSIGSNSVIGAGSVVTKNIPENVVAAGNPCRVLREINN